jgi:hypothetical protein
LTGTTGQDIAKRDWEVRKSLFKDPNMGAEAIDMQPTDDFVAAKLRNSWIHRSDVSTSEMKSGTWNEENIARALRSKKWCKHFLEIGLVVSKQSRCVGVSADGVAKVRVPGLDGAVWASTEFKTRIAPEQVQKAQACRDKHGFEITCAVGDDVYWDAVPSSHRGQIIQQAAVLDVDWVVYVASCVASIRYYCFVKIPQDVRNAYVAALSKWSHLMDWAHESIDTDGPPPEPPQAFSEDDRVLISSRIRVWRALRKRIKREGQVLYPVYIIKAWAQVMYNFMKGGIDGSTQYIEDISRSSSSILGLATKLNLRALKHMLVNSFLVWRKGQVLMSRSRWQTIAQYRKYANNNTQPLKGFATSLVVELLRVAKYEKFVPPITLSDNTEFGNQEGVAAVENTNVAAAPTAEERRLFFQEHKLKSSSRASKRFRAYNSNVGRKIRCTGTHKAEEIGKTVFQSGKQKDKVRYLQATCALCSTSGATMKCKTCDVPLHSTAKAGIVAGESCFQRWHSLKQLKRADSVKKRKSLDEKQTLGNNADAADI